MDEKMFSGGPIGETTGAFFGIESSIPSRSETSTAQDPTSSAQV